MDVFGIELRFFLVQLVGFIIMVFVLSKYAFGPILGMLQTRQDSIRNNLDEAEARRNEMVRLQNEYQQRLAQIEDEARDKIQSAVRDAQAARDEIIARAHTESQEILARGQQDIARERAQAMAQMRDQIAELAIAAATRVTRQHLNPQSHASLIDEVIGSIGVNGTGPGNGTPGGGAH
ncbi:MAG: F0F1 ATP synthase subunit B [Abitibacteriaceae bacterium]|nr:F0F1 ATP synthase subunit B [Abditibacteriaceae bacterium]